MLQIWDKKKNQKPVRTEYLKWNNLETRITQSINHWRLITQTFLVRKICHHAKLKKNREMKKQRRVQKWKEPEM